MGNIIEVNNVSKQFVIPHSRAGSIKEAVVHPTLFTKVKSREIQDALKGVSFQVEKGEFFGIVGRNGSGKSTLLKILAGVYYPTHGSTVIHGSLTPFIELGVGFNGDLSGRDNVYLNGALLGFSRKQMDEKYNEIVEFAELEKFMDQKLKNYSSGMQVRLAFSIAIRANTDILLLDEVLAVGDANFQKKCYDHFLTLKKQNKTVVLVTHDMSAIERFCDKAMVLDQGIVKGVFEPREASVIYEKLNRRDETERELNKSKDKLKINRWGTGTVQTESFEFKNKKVKLGGIINVDQAEEFKLKINMTSQDKKDMDIVVGLAFYDQFGVNISGPNSTGHDITSSSKVTFSTDKLSFNPGVYYMTIALFDADTAEEFDHIEKGMIINVGSDGIQRHGKINMFETWESS